MVEQLLAEGDLALGGESEGGNCAPGRTINSSLGFYPFWQTRSGVETLSENGLAQGRDHALAQAHQSST
jgi:hypothetical protein